MIELVQHKGIREIQRSWGQKEKDLALTLKAMGKHPERYPDAQRRADELTDQIVDDMRAIGRIVVRMDIWRIGAEL